MDIVVQKRDKNIFVITPKGSLDLYTVGDFKNAIENTFKTVHPKIIINLEDLAYIDSAGLGVLIIYHSKVLKYGGFFCLCNLKYQTIKIFQLSHTTHLFKIFSNLDEALSAFL